MTITVSCPSCDTSFPVDPAKVPPEGVRAQCSNCPEIFDVDPPSEAIPEAPPATDTVEVSDPLDTALIDPPAVEESPEGDVSEAEDFGDVELAIEEPDSAGSAAEVVEADAKPVPDPERETAEAVPAEEASATPSGGATEATGAIRFGRRSAEDKAKSLARSLVSDLIAYNPDKHREALAAGTLPEVFSEEIDKSLKEYQEQVDAEVIAKGTFFNDALNSILAEEKSIFSLDA